MLQGKTALVTGGSRGIGKAIALKLGENGARVAVNYAGNEAAAAEVVNQLQEMGVDALKMKADVSQADQVNEMVK